MSVTVPLGEGEGGWLGGVTVPLREGEGNSRSMLLVVATNTNSEVYAA